MKQGEIYRYEDPRAILVHCFQEKKTRNPGFSLRAWSKKLGFKTPSYLCDVLNGKRKLKPAFALQVSENLDLTPMERRYFETLVFLNDTKSEEQKKYYQVVLNQFKPVDARGEIEPGNFPELKHWYYGTLDEMTSLADFKEDYSYLASRLGHGITPQAIKVAIKDILKIGLIKRDQRGQLKRTKKWMIKEEEDPSKKEHVRVREYKREFLQLASRALDEQNKLESLYRQSNIPIKKKDFEKITSLADSFFEEIYGLESKGSADEVFHVGVISYRLTQPKER